jgi:hypothetical protein
MSHQQSSKKERDQDLGSTFRRHLKDLGVVRNPAAWIAPRALASAVEAALGHVEVAIIMSDAPRAMKFVTTGFHTAPATAVDAERGTTGMTGVRDVKIEAHPVRHILVVGNLVTSPEVDHAIVVVLAHARGPDLVDSETAANVRHLAAAVAIDLAHVVQTA